MWLYQGGVAALVGCYFVGPRGTDVFEHDKADIPGHSMPMVQLGTMILFFGFIGFNGGSVLALDSAADGAIMSLVLYHPEPTEPDTSLRHLRKIGVFVCSLTVSGCAAMRNGRISIQNVLRNLVSRQ